MMDAAVWLVMLLALIVATSIALWRSGSEKYRPPTLLLAAAALLVQMAVSALIVVGAAWAYLHYSPQWYVPVLAATLGCVLLWFILLVVVLRFTLKETVKAGFVVAITAGCVLGFAAIPLLVLYRTYQVPTNVMAPTLRGDHLLARCPSCGGLAIVSFQKVDGAVEPRKTGICAHCLHVRPAEHVDQQPTKGDRIFVRRYATPRRWDVVVFLLPGEGDRPTYAMRLVGLPGESVEVKEGGVWINGVRHQPPPAIADLRWELPSDAGLAAQFATEGNPVLLKRNQYFVLGDNSTSSNDSRFWGPLLADDLRGVVSAVYWPPNSARFLPRH